MPERLKKRGIRVVGVRQALRAVKEGQAETVFVAMDADSRLRQQVEREAEANAVPVQMISTMEELAALCRVDVPSAAAAILRYADTNPAQTNLPDASKAGQAFD